LDVLEERVWGREAELFANQKEKDRSAIHPQLEERDVKKGAVLSLLYSNARGGVKENLPINTL